MAALGAKFRAAREARGLSLSEVAEQVRIRAIYLDAIEKEDWSAIGAPVYIRGFLRTYARFLGLDAEEIVAEFNLGEGERGAIVVSRGDIADIERAGGGRGLQLSPLIWIASLVAIILVAFVVYNELTLKPGATVAFVATPTPVPTPAATSSAIPAGTPTLNGTEQYTLRLSGLCWLRVTADGKTIVEGTFPAGTLKAFSGRSVNVLVGNAGAVDLVVGGKDLGKMGAEGEVVQKAFTPTDTEL